MSNKEKYDAIIVLGGGGFNSGNLTPLSIQRLEKAYELYSKGKSRKIFVLGGHYSTYSPKAIYFQMTGAEIRKQFLLKIRGHAQRYNFS